MDQKPRENAFQFLDKLQFNRFHVQLMIFTTLSSVVMGIISQTVAYILPLVLKEWSLTPVEGGSIASYTFVGLMLGAAGFGILSDRIGRKKTLILAVAISGIFNGLAFFAPDYTVFCVLRFLSGLGLGGIPPLSVTLLSELVPTRMRAKAVTTATCGFPFGWALSGVVAMFVVPHFGWRVLLAVSGLIAMALIPFLIVYLPESIRFLSGKGRNEEAGEQMRRIEKTARLTASQWTFDSSTQGARQVKGALSQLFSTKLATMTILVWLSYFFTLLTVHGLSVWIPQLFVKAGYSLVKSYSFSIVQSMWAMVGGFFLGFLLDHFGRKPGLLLSYMFGGFSILIFSIADSPAFLYLAGIATGLFVLPLPSVLHVVAGEIYPTSIRATGVGWAAVASRVGSILGPIFGGAIQMAGLGFHTFFFIFALPCFICMIFVVFYRVNVKNDALEEVSSKLMSRS
ncbi:MAG TPA: MFS transporter [Syntrophorhabdus sp.]|nr:MFS transporter [Pseudomonadota bacterium]OPX94289.1 MAG: 4-hydroxybenzoate transporter PcaK [Syntrophorhabdus sp. PtaB.Bin027]OQB77077.1 MAG: 4-hydroxybenzoate transporter PcaK [Deltaproteobacteria bacterium ADurb.Bin135]HNQ45359.1 MFS transporter [Syntrophorhabdus sp.]HNS77394.1 MFS transporter [Syntrophorhabdus sp.]